MTRAFLPSITATQLLVVPRSIPMILLIRTSRVSREVSRWRSRSAAGKGVPARWQRRRSGCGTYRNRKNRPQPQDGDGSARKVRRFRGGSGPAGPRFACARDPESASCRVKKDPGSDSAQAGWGASMKRRGGAAVVLGLIAGVTGGTHAWAGDATERVSVSSSGLQARGGPQDNPGSLGPAISASGRFVAFESDATNLVPDDTNRLTDVFVRDRKTGTTERVSVGAHGAQAKGGSYGSFGAAISADGRYVAFASDDTNLVPDDTNDLIDVFVHDRLTGTTERVSVATGGGQATGGNYTGLLPSISANGRFVAFEAEADNLVPNDTNFSRDVFVHDRVTGRTERVSINSNGTQAEVDCEYPTISATGRFVAFARPRGAIAGCRRPDAPAPREASCHRPTASFSTTVRPAGPRRSTSVRTGREARRRPWTAAAAPSRSRRTGASSPSTRTRPT